MSKAAAPWRVGRWAPGEYADYPWYACDRGGWFGRGHPGASFATWGEAMSYAVGMARLLDRLVGYR